MRRSFLLLGVLIGLANCQTRQTTSDAGNAPADSTVQCYQYASATDTVRLSLNRTNESVRGDLAYQLSGKDRNVGTLAGRMRGDTLLADYTFRSEGVESVRQVAFVVQAGGLVEGYGSVREQAGRMVFTNVNDLTFDARRVLAKTECPN